MGDHGFAWFGKRPPRLPRKLVRSLDPDVRRGYLTQALAEHLYAYFYIKGHASPMHWEALAAGGGSAAFVAGLRRSNAGTGSWEAGWRRRPGPAAGSALAELRLERAGLRVSLLDERLVQRYTEDAHALRMPKELLGRSPGHYLALSDEPVPPASPVVRVYWNCTPRAALSLVAELTSSLNGDGIPYQLKVLDDPAAFDRCDAVVLYLPADAFLAAHPLLDRAHRLLADDRRARVPVFTKQLGAGVGLAEDTDNGRSFGMHRCRLLADGLVEASAEGRRTLLARLTFVDEYLAEQGVLLDTSYLRPGSVDDYPGFDCGPSARPARAPVAGPANDDLLDVARRLGDRLVADAFRDGEVCTWLGSVVPAGDGRVLATLGPALYEGLAGVALVLAQLAEPNCVDAARAALRQAARHREDIAPERRLGLFDGWTGLALVQGYVACQLDEPVLRAEACTTAHEALSQPCTEHDLISGAAGGVLTAVALVRLTGDRTLLDDAVRLGDLLVEHATPAGDGLSWSTINRKGEYHLTGLSHGTAGIALALLELAEATGDTRYLVTAEGGFRHERSWFDPAVGNWPDLRETRATRGAGSGALAYSTYWCHGAPGIAISRVRAWQLTNDALYRDEALTALATTRAFVRETSTLADQSLCHGVLGNAVVLSFAGRALGDRPSEWAAREAVARAVAAHGGGRWPLGTPAESPGLMLGTAGIAHALLWLRDPTEPMVLLPGLLSTCL
ncbi:lanthionine synthetase LanC family protein [Actinosynnema sp. NPDC023794]